MFISKILITLGLLLTFASIAFLVLKREEIKIRRYIFSLISIGLKHPIIEHLVPMEYGYRAIVKLPNKMTKQQFDSRKEALEFSLGYEVRFAYKEDILYIDIFKDENKLKLS